MSRYLEKIALFDRAAGKLLSSFGLGKNQMMSKGLLAGAGIGTAAGLVANRDNPAYGGIGGGVLGGAIGAGLAHATHNKYLSRIQKGIGAATSAAGLVGTGILGAGAAKLISNPSLRQGAKHLINGEFDQALHHASRAFSKGETAAVEAASKAEKVQKASGGAYTSSYDQPYEDLMKTPAYARKGKQVNWASPDAKVTSRRASSNQAHMNSL